MDSVITSNIQVIVDAISSIGFVGLLIILAIPNLRVKFGFGNSNKKETKSQDTINEKVKDTLEDHAKHLEIANKEMGDIRDTMKMMSDSFIEMKGDIKAIKKDVEWLKK